MTDKNLNSTMITLLIVAICALAAMVQAVFLGGLPAWLQAPLAIGTVCFLPGYAVSLAVHGRGRITGSERLFMSLALSLCATVGVGILLHFSPWGITRVSVASCLGVIALAACGVAGLREQLAEHTGGQAPLARGFATYTWRGPQVEHALRLPQVAMLIAAVAIAAGAVAISYVAAQQTTATDVVQLWMLPAESAGTTSGDGSRTVRLGVNNLGTQPLDLRLSLVQGGYKLQETESLRVDSGQKWETRFRLPGVLPGSGPVEAILYRADVPFTVFRRVSIWVK